MKYEGADLQLNGTAVFVNATSGFKETTFGVRVFSIDGASQAFIQFELEVCGWETAQVSTNITRIYRKAEASSSSKVVLPFSSYSGFFKSESSNCLLTEYFLATKSQNATYSKLESPLVFLNSTTRDLTIQNSSIARSISFYLVTKS